jgi:hypothetical protein
VDLKEIIIKIFWWTIKGKVFGLVSDLGSHSYFIGCITSERDTNKSKITGLMYCRTVEVPGPWPCASLSVGHKSTTQTIRWISFRRLPFDTGISWSRLWLNESVGGTVFWNEIGYSKNCDQVNQEWKWGQMSFRIHHKGERAKTGAPPSFTRAKVLSLHVRV